MQTRSLNNRGRKAMQFPIAIHKDEGSVYGVTVPDIPGVHSWGDTVDKAIRNTREAIAGHLQTLAELGEDVDVVLRCREPVTDCLERRRFIFGVQKVKGLQHANCHASGVRFTFNHWSL